MESGAVIPDAQLRSIAWSFHFERLGSRTRTVMSKPVGTLRWSIVSVVDVFGGAALQGLSGASFGVAPSRKISGPS